MTGVVGGAVAADSSTVGGASALPIIASITARNHRDLRKTP